MLQTCKFSVDNPRGKGRERKGEKKGASCFDVFLLLAYNEMFFPSDKLWKIAFLPAT